jgi:hypothetical protein
MAPEAAGHEIRTRVTLFLPAHTFPEELAVHAITRYLEGQRRNRIAVTGFTRSQFPDMVFFGYWWEEEWYREGVVLFIIDYDLPLDAPRLEQTLRRLRQIIERRYRNYECEQREIWLIAQRVLRYA